MAGLLDQVSGMLTKLSWVTKVVNTSLAAKGALANRLQRRTAAPPAKSKMTNRGPQNGRQVWKGLPLYFGRSRQLSLNKFFDLNTPSIRKGSNGRKKGVGVGGGQKRKKIKTF